MTVIFDAGLPAGEAKHLSGGGVKAVFAPNNSSADAVIIRRIEAIGNPPEYVIVTSDNAVAAAATRRRIAVQPSETFAANMMSDRRFGGSDNAESKRPEAPAMNPDEMQEWLSIFGPEPETPRPARPARKTTPPKPTAPKKKTEEEKAADDIDEWLRLFGYKE